MQPHILLSIVRRRPKAHPLRGHREASWIWENIIWHLPKEPGPMIVLGAHLRSGIPWHDFSGILQMKYFVALLSPHFLLV